MYIIIPLLISHNGGGQGGAEFFLQFSLNILNIDENNKNVFEFRYRRQNNKDLTSIINRII